MTTTAPPGVPSSGNSRGDFVRPMLLREGRRPVFVEPVDGTMLHPVVNRPPLGTYLDLLWRRRHFIVADARARVLTGNAGTLLGRAWLVLGPLLDVAVYLVIFGVLLTANRGIDNFIGYLVIGTFLFRLTSGALQSGARSIITGRTLVRSFSFPRAALPVAAVARETFSFVPTFVIMVVLVLFTHPRAEDTWAAPIDLISWRWLLVPLVLALQVMLTLGLALMAARATARIPDLAQLIGVFTRFWLYGSAVFFSFERFISHPDVLRLVQLNPMFIVIDMVRDCLLYGTTPAWTSWVVLSAWAVGSLVVGMVFFWRGEESYGSE